MDIPLHDRWRYLELVTLHVPQYAPPHVTQPGDPDKQAELKRTLPIIYTQYRLLDAD